MFRNIVGYGKVIGYGTNKGDPMVMPSFGGKTVILENYAVKPEIGATVIYKISKKGKHKVHYADLLFCVDDTSEETFDGIEGVVKEILDLWEFTFADCMSPESNKNFPKSVLKIEELYNDGEYDEALMITKIMYEWASDGVKECKKYGRGFHFRSMKREIENLGNKILDSCNRKEKVHEKLRIK